MIDSDLAELYGVETKVLLQAVMRNINRFPEDFLFHLNSQELKRLRSQFVTSKSGSMSSKFPVVTSNNDELLLIRKSLLVYLFYNKFWA